MNKKEEKNRTLIALIITFALLILFLVMILISALGTPDKIKQRNKVIVDQMLNALNMNINEESEKANKLISFSYNEEAFYITGKSETRMFFYTYQTQINHIDAILNSFYKQEDTYLTATELTYCDISNEQYEDNTIKNYIALTSKSLDDKYHISMLVQNAKNSYTPISHAEQNSLADKIDVESFPTYTQKESKGIFDLLNYIYSSY